jgi:peptide chain release factor 1
VRAATTGFHQINIEVEGPSLAGLDGEAGGHRFQRVPANERRNRVHTSTVTVGVIDPQIPVPAELLRRGESDFRLDWYSGSGAGGQHRNKHQNCARLLHVPTGIIKTAMNRERTSSEREVREAMAVELDQRIEQARQAWAAVNRKAQIGTGMRGDKIRTYRTQDDITTDHVKEKRLRTSLVMRGGICEFWTDST